MNIRGATSTPARTPDRPPDLGQRRHPAEGPGKDDDRPSPDEGPAECNIRGGRAEGRRQMTWGAPTYMLDDVKATLIHSRVRAAPAKVPA